MAGYVKLYRQLREWEWYRDQNTKDLFLHCLISANHRPNRWQGILIEAGSFITSSLKLSKETGISRQCVRTSINRLKSTNEITIESTNKYIIISIVKWADYQGFDVENNQVTNQVINFQLTNNQPATNQQLTTNNNDKKYKNEKNEKKKDLKILKPMSESDGWFNEFWNIYPKKVQRKTSEQKFKINVKDVLTFNAIMYDLHFKVKSNDWLKENGQYVPNPTTYLNQRRWEDEKKSEAKKSTGSRFMDLYLEEQNEQK
jgi:hypothetical protein